MNNIDPHLKNFFVQHDISYEYHEHIPVFTVEESAEIKDALPGAHTKNLFLTDKKGGFYLVSIEAHKRFPVKLFRKELGVKELSFGTPEQLYEKLHLTPGSVSLFGLIYDLPPSVHVFIDQDLRNAPLIGRHPNRNDATIVLDHEMVEKFLSCTGHTPSLLVFDDEKIEIIE